MLPALEKLGLIEPAAGPDGGRQLAAGLRAGALPAVTELWIGDTHVGDAGASALAAALGQGALPRLESLALRSAAIGDAALVASRRPCAGSPHWRASLSVSYTHLTLPTIYSV